MNASDAAFAELVVAQGIAKKEQVAECLADLAAMRDRGVRPLPTLGELLVRRGYLTVESLKTVGTAPAAPLTGLPPEAQTAAMDPANSFGRYVRVALLGRGGMGEVWRAWDRDLARWVALKFLHEKAVIDRFRQEAQTSARLNHPNIAAVYEVSEHGGIPFIAMQFVKGRSLAEHSRKDTRATAEMIRDAALAVHHAHQQGVIHRDLKPGNIMVEDGTRRVYVLDFGLARRRDVKGPLSVTGVAVGTPSFMPPEQAAGERADERSDVYGLGATLYALVTGRAPFEGEQVLDVLIKVLEGDLVPPRQLDSGIDADLETIVLTCLSTESGRRYASAKALADDLQRWLDGDAIVARRASVVYRARKYVGRRKAKFAAAALAVVLAIVVGIYWFGIRPGAAALALEAEVFDPIRHQLRELPRTAEGLKRGLELVDGGLAKCPGSWDGWMRKGELHEHLREEGPALEAYDRALALKPGLAAARYRRGRVLMDLRKDDVGAAREFEEALKIDPGHEFAQVAAARIAIAGRRWADAWNALEQTTATKYLGEAHRLKGFLHQSPESGRHDLAEALAAYDRALDLDAGDIAAYYNRGILKASQARQLMGRGQLRESVARFGDAIGDYGHAIAAWPGLVDAWLNRITAHHWRAEALEALGRTTEAAYERKSALREGDQVLVMAPGRAEVHLGRGLLLDDLGDVHAAEAAYSEALRLDPRNGEAWSNRGALRDRMAEEKQREGKSDDARALRLAALSDHDRAVDFSIDKAPALSNRGGVRRRLGDLEGALDDLGRAAALSPETAEYPANLGAIRTQMAQAAHDSGRYDEALRIAEPALRDLDRALAINPASGIAWSNRARVNSLTGDAHARLGRVAKAQPYWSDALADIDKAIERGLNDAASRYQRARLLSLTGDDAGAITEYGTALKLDPKHAPSAYNRGCLWRDRGETIKAIEDFTRAVEAEPAYHDAWVNRAVMLAQLAIAYEDGGKGDLAAKARAAALRDYARALDLRPRQRLTFFNRGVLYAQARMYAEAIRDFTSAIDVDPDDLGSYANRASSKLAAGDFAGAEADAETVLKKAPADWPPRKAVERIRDEARAKK